MNDFPDLFGYTKPTTLVGDTYTCIKCHIEQPACNFQLIPTGEVKRTCSSCIKGHYHTLKKLRKENKYPHEDYCCPICQRDIQEVGKYGQVKLNKWVLDHCHDTLTFRGWICHHCNSGLGGFKDDLTKVKRAVKYLKKHKESLNETDT
jgi:hypothetical protein